MVSRVAKKSLKFQIFGFFWSKPNLTYVKLTQVNLTDILRRKVDLRSFLQNQEILHDSKNNRPIKSKITPKNEKKKLSANSTPCSQAVTHPSTDEARRCFLQWSDENRCAQHGTYPPAMLKLSILYNTHISILTLSILRNTQLEYKMLSIYNTQLVFCIIWNPYFKYGIHISNMESIFQNMESILTSIWCEYCKSNTQHS